MKLKIIAFAIAATAAIVGAVESSQARRLGPIGSFPFAGQCLQKQTDQPICTNANTGPVCTVTGMGLPTTTAYDTFTGGGCIRPLRQP